MYDIFGRLSTVTDTTIGQVTSYEYDLVGNLSRTITKTNTNTLITTYEYDNMNRLVKLTNYVDKNNNGIFDNGEGVSQFIYDLDKQGRKLSAIEKFWMEYGEQENNIDWIYDDTGRLIYEKFDHYNDEFDQTSEWIYDLVGNRLQQTINGTITTYTYDVNDRLLDEVTNDKTTSYGYDHTQQTSKTISENNSIVSKTTFEYDVQGRMSVVTIVSGNRTEIIRYGYGTDGIRVSTEHDVWEDGELKSKTRTEYLNDSKSLTSYSQVLRQTEYDADGNIVKETSYIIGHQRISQTIEVNGTKKTHYFAFDGHGSTRVLLDAAMTIAQIFAYDAYGNAIGFVTSEALTDFLYSGEQFDSKIGQQYLRARYYDPATGRFNRLDPFFGNVNDPLSLHNYLYAHSNPITYTDPSGEVAIFFPLIALLGGAGIGYAIGGRWDTALLGGAVSLGFALSSPLIVFSSLIGGYFLPWNNQYNLDYRKDFWDLMDKKEFEYDHGLGFEYNYDTPTQVFLQFKGGIGESFSRAYYFGNCPMTKAMREHPHIYRLRGEIKMALILRDIGNNQTIPTFHDFRKKDHSFYSVPMQNIIDDAIIIMTETFSSMIYNEQSDAWEAQVLKSVLGSFGYDFQIRSVDWNLRTAVVRFRTGNALGWRSATRLPWTEDASLFGDQKTGILADVTQFFLWEEEISF